MGGMVMSESVIPVMPIEASADTKRNSYCFGCQVLEQQPHYALCLHKLALRKQGRLKEDWQGCSTAIGKKTCPAIDMREREVEKGRALYFIERVHFTGLASLVDAAKQLFNRPTVAERTAARKAKEVVKVKVKDDLDLDIDGGGYEDAISEAAKKLVAMKVEAKAGESLLDMARRMMAQPKG